MKNLNDVPDCDSAKYTETIPIKVDAETKRMWDELRRVHKKNNAEWGRQLLRDGFKKLLGDKKTAG